MALPLVLFMGLVYVREKVDDDSFGPFTFEHNEIYPMSSTVARSLLNVFDSSVDDLNASLRSSGKYGDTGAMIQKTSDADKAMETMRQELGSMIGGVICNNHSGTVSESIANHMEPMLAMKYDGKTLAHHMLHVNASHDGEWVRSMVEEVQAWNMSKVVAELDAARHHYLNSGWPRMIEDAAKRVDEELDKLNALLDHPKGSHGTHLMVGHWVDSACSLHLNNATVLANMSAAWNALNASHLAKEMASMREVLKKAGIVDMFNSTSTSSLSKSMSSMMNSIMKMMNNLASTENSDEVSKMMQSMFGSLQTTSAHELAEFADTAAWWISHFVRTRGLVARLLGEQPSNAWDMDWASMTSSNAGMSAFSGMRTDMADTLFQSLRHFQNGTNAANTTHDMQKAWKSMSTSMSSMMNSMSLTMQNESTSIMKKLEGHIQEMMHYNLSGMEHVMLPKWSSDWQTSCPQHLNKSYISSKVDSMRMRCPFYRRQVRHLAKVNLSQEVAYLHKHLAQWNSQRTWRFPIFRAQHELRVNGNATKLGESVRHAISDLQHKLHHDRGKGMCTDCVYKGIVDARQAQGTAQVKQYASILGNSVQGMLHDHLGVKNTQCEAGRKLAERMNFFDQIMNQKILVAPYKGEARELMHYMFVELAQSLTITNENSRLADMPKPLEALLRCPLVKAALAVGIDLFMKDRMVTFGTEAELEDYARRNPKKVLMALVFHNADPATGNFPTGTLTVDYAIRAHAQYLPQTSKILRLARNAIFGAVRMSFYYYIDLYFAHIQEAMGRSVARLRANRELAGPGSNYSTIGRNIGASARTEKARQLGMALQQFPAPEYTVDKFIRAIQHTMPMFMMLGWIYAVSLLVKEMVYEKQEKLRDVMRIQGLKTWVYWSSWMASAMIQWMFLVTAIVCILSGGGVLRHSNPLIIFIFFSSYSLATVSFSMLISAFFSRAKVAAACAGLLYYGSYMPYSFFNRFEDVLTLNAKNAFCLLSSTGMGIGSGLLAKWELLEIGVQWSNLFQAPPITYSGAEPKDNFSLGSVMLMFYIDTIVYQVLAWYVQKVRPGTLGLPQPWYFPFLRSYWLGARDVPDMLDVSSDDAEQKDNAKLECWEGPSSDLEVVVKMRGLTKTFSRGKKALKGISLDMHRGTILGLLGHNGAGKSTTMSILTGLYPPTAGDVVVNGRSVQKDSQGVRQQLGVCLQHNALYEWITVEEHLSLFCCLKSVPWQEMKSTVQGLLEDTGLMHKRHAPSKALSGGMKRKLSIGIALSGGSKVITLDEPTAGIDANSRREIWQLLARQKSQRTILLSTHFMDEADILSDRIAIIAEGELTAIGTGMTLKKHFADKYMLTLVTADVVNPARLSSLICTAVPDAEFAGSRGRELSYLLPGGARGHFAGLFKQLQDPEARAAVGIETYGLSAATMKKYSCRPPVCMKMDCLVWFATLAPQKRRSRRL
jgi:ABC-type multidrug transport system ATPase subunit